MGERGERGEAGPPGRLPIAKAFRAGAVHYESDVVLHAGATFQALRDTASTPPGDDWACLAAAGRDAAMPVIKGTWRDGEPYSFMDIVALNGSSFVARSDNPGPCPGAGWQLIASAGKPGQRGPKGEAGTVGQVGPRGAPGQAAPTILGWNIDRQSYEATPIMSDDSVVPPMQLRGLFEQFHGEAR